MRKFLPVFPAVFLSLLLLSARPAQAAFRHQILNDVLGDSTSSALPQIPPTTEGPGLILPDSPFFFLDQLKQNVRLFFAFSPEDKAQVRAQIAGERLAELRFMLARNNKEAAEVDLRGIAENLTEASSQLSKAQFSGKDVTGLARKLNSDIKLKQKTLDSLETQAKGGLKLEVEQTQEDIFQAKTEAEDSLPDNEIENEVKDDLARRIERKVKDASQSAVLLRKDLDELNKEASESAAKSLKKREEALKEAIKKRDEALTKVEEKLLENEKKRVEKLLEIQKEVAEQAREALFNAQSAAVGLQKARQVIQDIKSPEAASVTGISNSTSPGSSGSGGSSSGSSGTPKPFSTPQSGSGDGGGSSTPKPPDDGGRH